MSDRPKIITGVCVYCYLSIAISFVYILLIISDMSLQITILITLLTILTGASCYGMWKMEKWGAYLFMICTIADFLFALMLGITYPLSGFLIRIIAGCLAVYYIN